MLSLTHYDHQQSSLLCGPNHRVQRENIDPLQHLRREPPIDSSGLLCGRQ